MSSKYRLSLSISVLLTLCMALCATSFALGYTFLRTDDSFFRTGTVEIALQEGNFLIQGSSTGDFLFEPGMRVCKTFSIENKSTDPAGVWYQLYFDQVDGSLADIIEVTVSYGSQVVLSGKLSAMTRENTSAPEKLSLQESREFTVEFHYPEHTFNDGQGGTAVFVLCAEAVQGKNNPLGRFH